MSLTEQIIEVVERGRIHGHEAGVHQMLYAIGCTRLVNRTGVLIAYYHDEHGQEHFVICTP
jgi:hypothetical protein